MGRECGGEVCATDIVLMSRGGVGVVEFFFFYMESGLSELLHFRGNWVEWAGMSAALCTICVERYTILRILRVC